MATLFLGGSHYCQVCWEMNILDSFFRLLCRSIRKAGAALPVRCIVGADRTGQHH